MATTSSEPVATKYRARRLQNRIHSTPPSQLCPNSLPKKSIHKNCTPSRSEVTPSKKSNTRGSKSSKGTGVLLPSLSGKKTSGGLSIYSKSKDSESNCKIQKVQNGQHSICDSSLTEQRLFSNHRPKGCLPTSTNPPLFSTVSEVCRVDGREEIKEHIFKESYGSARHSDFLLPGSTMGPVPLKISPVVDSKVMEQVSSVSRQKAHHSTEYKGLSSVVAESSTPFPRSSVELSTTSYNYNRCQLVGLGSPLQLSTSSGEMECCREVTIFKQQRTGSSMASIVSFQPSDHRLPCQNRDRQQECGSLLKQAGRHEESKLMGNDSENPFLGRKESQISNSNTLEGYIEPGGRLPKQKKTGSERVVSGSGDIPPGGITVGISRSRPFCKKGKCKVSSVLCSVSKGSPMEVGRLYGGLGDCKDVCLSANTTFIKSDKEDCPGSGPSNPNSSTLAEEAMVHISEKISSFRSNCFSSSSTPNIAGSSPASGSGKTTPFSLELEWGMLKAKGFSDGLSETLIQSRKKVTRTIYQKAWRVFSEWCLERSCDRDSLTSVLEFLQCGYKKGLSISTLKVQVSAISVYLEKRLAQEDLVIRFFQALKRLKPIIRSRVPAWDLNTVLQGLCESPFEPLTEISDKFLTLKTAFLLAITSARRISELQSLSIKEPYCIISEDRITLRPDAAFLPKVVSSFHRNQEIFLPSFCENPTNDKEKKLHCLDVRRCLLHYLNRTAHWRKTETMASIHHCL
ncbi:uncharacterized protein [Hyperolius riggenbachi]|uniref:uncharacterized protein n=1 Tax=Hyperolius riggenbachi TaxID=752182 RepID=UPI0035A34F4C